MKEGAEGSENQHFKVYFFLGRAEGPRENRNTVSSFPKARGESRRSVSFFFGLRLVPLVLVFASVQVG